MAKSVIAEVYQMPAYSPPLPRTTYTTRQVPRDIRGLPPDPAQPQFTIWVPEVTQHVDYFEQWGYIIGYMIAERSNKVAAESQLKWIDKVWLHPGWVAPGKPQLGYLPFPSAQLPVHEKEKQRNKKTKGKEVQEGVDVQAATEKAVDAEGATTVSAQQQTPPGDRAMKLVIFIEDQQFVLHFGPETVEREFKRPCARSSCEGHNRNGSA